MYEAEWPGLPSRAPQRDGTSAVVIYVYVEDVDKELKRAVTGGAKIPFPVAKQFWATALDG